MTHTPGLEKVTDASKPPGIPQAEMPPQPLPDIKRERRSQRLVCCLVVVITLVMSALGGILAYYLFFKLPQPF